MKGVSYVFAIGGMALHLVLGERTMEKSISLFEGTIVILLGFIGLTLVSSVSNLI